MYIKWWESGSMCCSVFWSTWDNIFVQGDTWNVVTRYNEVYQCLKAQYAQVLKGKTKYKRNTPAEVLECTAHCILIDSVKWCKKKKCKRNWAVVLGVWLDQPVVILTVVIEKSEKEVHESVPWRLGWTAAHWWTGGGGLYRRRDHLICSLADWRTCEWKVLLTKQFTAATKFVLYWPVAKWQQYRISHWG